MSPRLTVKKQALNLTEHLPEKTTWDDILHAVYIRKKIGQGLEAADVGKVTSHDEIKRRFLRGSV
ncbi:MAG: hypothetical protein EPO61_01405 [Nitrospirae bacterium]|nr:MAG: hypothetical protein EPO61_01405 [Nitrospirota bacterium]